MKLLLGVPILIWVISLPLTAFAYETWDECYSELKEQGMMEYQIYSICDGLFNPDEQAMSGAWDRPTGSFVSEAVDDDQFEENTTAESPQEELGEPKPLRKKRRTLPPGWGGLVAGTEFQSPEQQEFGDENCPLLPED